MGRRVFISGLGLVVPHGEDSTSVFDRVYQGDSAIQLVRSGTAEFGSDVPLAVTEFRPESRIPKTQQLFMARASQMAVVAAANALESSGLAQGHGVKQSGIYMGCGLGGAEVLPQGYRHYFVRQSRRGRPSTVPMIMASGPASHISLSFGIQGPAHTYSIACASSTVAIGEAFRDIRDGYLDSALSGGAEAMLNDGSIAAWERLGVLAKSHKSGPETSSRPFDLERTGFVLGEGAVLLILEAEQTLQKRGVEPIAEIIGYGTSSDAFSLTEPAIVGQEAARTMLSTETTEDSHRGTIIFTNATAAFRGCPQSGAFAIASHGKSGLAQSMARELMPRGIHVAHVPIDAAVGWEQEDGSRWHRLAGTTENDNMANPDFIAETYLQLHKQHRSTWAFEVILRPWLENW